MSDYCHPNLLSREQFDPDFTCITSAEETFEICTLCERPHVVSASDLQIGQRDGGGSGVVSERARFKGLSAGEQIMSKQSLFA